MKRSQVEVTKILPDWTEEEAEDQWRQLTVWQCAVAAPKAANISR